VVADPEIIATRLVLAHWPDDEYILRGIAAQWGGDVIDGVKASLDRRRHALQAELEQQINAQER
jgi:hypothetical protein